MTMMTRVATNMTGTKHHPNLALLPRLRTEPADGNLPVPEQRQSRENQTKTRNMSNEITIFKLQHVQKARKIGWHDMHEYMEDILNHDE